MPIEYKKKKALFHTCLNELKKETVSGQGAMGLFD
jgi:hypothetical protein